MDNFTTALQIQQPIFNLDAIYARSATGLKQQAREAMLSRTRQAVRLHVKKAYYGLILARENVHAIDEALQSARAHYREARLALNEGLVTWAEVLAAEVRVLELEGKLIEAQNQMAGASDQLKFLLGLKDESTLIPSDSLSLPQNSLMGDHKNLLPLQRQDLRALQFQAQAVNRQVWMKRSGWFPKVNAFATVEWNASQAFARDASNWSVGFQLQWNLFDGLGHWGRVKQAAAQATEMETRIRQLQEKINLELRNAERAVVAAKKRVRIATSAVQQARESLRIVEARYEQGLEKTSDLLDAEARYTQAKVRLLQAKHDYNLAISELEFTRGQ